MEGVTTELNNWLKILTSYNDLSKEDLDVLSSSTNGVKELIGKMNTFVGSEDEFFARMAQEKYRNDREAREAIAEARLNEERQRYYEQTLWVLEQSLFARFHASMEPIRDLLLSKSGEELGKLTVQAIKCASFDEFVALL